MRDGNVLSGSKAMRMLILGGFAALGTGLLVAAAGFVVAPQHAKALPAYAAKEGKACGYCHVNSAGGGPRTDKGKEYQANGHKFK